jgi:hypothetical protein
MIGRHTLHHTSDKGGRLTKGVTRGSLGGH